MNARSFFCTLVFFILVASPGGFLVDAARAQAVAIKTSRVKMTEARVALDNRDFNAALPILEEGLALAESERDLELQASFQFQLGLALQQRSATSKSVGDINRAVDYYQRYLAFQPRSGSALNNLAQLYTNTKRGDEAVHLYRRAIDLNDSYRGFYAVNLANLFRDRGDLKEAARYYQIALEQNPEHVEAIEGLKTVFAEADVPALITHLWNEIDRRREVGATLGALQTLTRMQSDKKSEEPPPNRRYILPKRTSTAEREAAAIARQKIELLTCVVVGLARARFGPALFTQGSSAGEEQAEIARLMRNLSTDPDIGTGIREVIAAYSAPPVFRPENPASWWTDKGNPDRDPEQGWWPRDGFRMLLRALGDGYQHLDDPKTAETYYLYSLQLSRWRDGEADLDALVRLAELYFELGQVDRVHELTEFYAPSLFEGKGKAYKRSDYKKVYAFHRTLGVMYATMGQWESDWPLTSAIFQLENALEKRDIYNRRFAGEGKLPPIPIEPRLVALLAQGYEARGDNERADRLRIDYAANLVEDKEPAAARRLLETVDPARLDRRMKARYEALRTRLQTP
jgi:tetratricopeptide (TPR) repeat protein